MSEFMKADKGLTDDLNKATSYEDIVALLHNSVERSDLGVTRDPVSGQFHHGLVADYTSVHDQRVEGSVDGLYAGADRTKIGDVHENDVEDVSGY